MTAGEAPDAAEQCAVGKESQITAARMGLPVQRLPGNRLYAHEFTVEPQQWMRSTASPGVSADGRNPRFTGKVRVIGCKTWIRHGASFRNAPAVTIR
jgi:hypothetical protein